MKLFTKEFKKIVVDDYPFLCVIDQRSENERISFKIYPSSTKTSYFLNFFSWKKNQLATNLCQPMICAKLIHYAISSGWDYKSERAVLKLQDGDILVERLSLDELIR
ncbi:hypothetical protein ACYEXS_32670 [Paenibacillus sp. MAH-36]|uniref:Uncharacterized protein n=1 Tax=Paenibacillus violae TaxID=3077234 RepID=A0ABU3RQ32_9BACL|nr:hypothetical protein [Paenibacillus sp. PFR10]MDU0206279.1 hypothetical protein [Paenibacillus sp. PFR10]